MEAPAARVAIGCIFTSLCAGVVCGARPRKRISEAGALTHATRPARCRTFPYTVSQSKGAETSSLAPLNRASGRPAALIEKVGHACE